MLILGMYATNKALKQTNLKDPAILPEKVFHAHYVAMQIEDEIREIRKTDYPYRKKYEELKRGGPIEEKQEDSE